MAEVLERSLVCPLYMLTWQTQVTCERYSCAATSLADMKGMKSKILCSHAAGDRGFDPLRLAANPSTRPWLVEGELYNGCAATPCESPQLSYTPRPYMAATDTHMK